MSRQEIQAVEIPSVSIKADPKVKDLASPLLADQEILAALIRTEGDPVVILLRRTAGGIYETLYTESKQGDIRHALANDILFLTTRVDQPRVKEGEIRLLSVSKRGKLIDTLPRSGATNVKVHGKNVFAFDDLVVVRDELESGASLRLFRSRFRGVKVPSIEGSVGTIAAGNAMKNSQPPTAIAPFDATQAKAHQQAWADHLGVPVESTNSIGMKLVVIPPGEFMMGSPDSEPERNPDETYHKVTLTQPFQMGAFEVTQLQYEKVIGANPSSIKGPDNPVEQITWDEASEFCRRLSALAEEKARGHVYRLPTEAEWEFACRSGTVTAYSFGDDAKKLRGYSWFAENSGDKDLEKPASADLKIVSANNGRTHPVGQKKANGFGLYDMHGNVWESCQDSDAVLPSHSVIDPKGGSSDLRRVRRGGSMLNAAEFCRSADRYYDAPSFSDLDMGFRVSLSLSIQLTGDHVEGTAIDSTKSIVMKATPSVAIAPFDSTQAKVHQKAWADHLGVPVESTNSIGIKLVLIPPGEFMMGSPESERELRPDETLHQVTLTQSFQIGVCEVTQLQYEKVIGANPSSIKGPDNPVEQITWDEASEFCRRLSALPEEEAVGHVYRLPTEAEWV